MDNTNLEFRQGRSAMRMEVEEFARHSLSTHVMKCEEYAVEKIQNTILSELFRIRKQDEERLRYIEQLGGVTSSHSQSLSIEQRTVSCAAADLAFVALNDIVANFTSRASHPDYDKNDDLVIIQSVDNVPKYDAWVPVRTNFWVGKDMELEPYMPYFGDDNEGRSKAFDLYKDMAQDAKQENQLSDGEVDERGELTEPNSEAAWVKYESLSQVRFRAGCREAILQVLDRYDGNSPFVVEGLSMALNIKDKLRLHAVAKVAQTRRRQKQEETTERKKRAKLRKEVLIAMTLPQPDVEVRKGGLWTKAALKNFCFTCQVFYCRQHVERDVEPMIPIADPTVDRREKEIHAGKVSPCSSKCYMMGVWNQTAQNARELEAWTPDEIMALRESTAVFRRDPCSLAIVVGSRSCREVLSKLEEAEEEALMRRSIAEAKQKRKMNMRLKSQRTADSNPRENESDVEDIPIVEVGVPKSSKKKAHKRVERCEQSNENEDFMPCYHNGKCTVDTCTCVKRGLNCESTCACNNARFCIGPNKTGITRYVDGEACGNLSPGCLCKKGHCNTDNCDCWRDNRACNPDVCSECDCNILPSQLASSTRRCRNVSVSIARHKRTYVGKSDVHGYGLFAGDYFEQGDLVGIYGGQLLDTRLADMVGRLYDAKDHTFFFDITETIVIDGGVLGMKSKFCNHSNSGGQDENVHSKMIRVRGEAHIALFTKRAVNPGEELKFDYKFQSVVPPWAKAMNGAKEEPMPVGVEAAPMQRSRSKSRSKRS